MTSTERLEPTEQIVARGVPLEKLCGVYFLIRDGKIVYVGQSGNILMRLFTHERVKFTHWAFVPCPAHRLDIVESSYIHALQAEENREGTRKGEKSAPLSIAELEHALALEAME